MISDFVREVQLSITCDFLKICYAKSKIWLEFWRWFDGGHHFGWVSKAIRSWQHRNRFVDAQGRLRSWELISDWLKKRVVFQEGKKHEILNLLEYIDIPCIYIYSTYSILVWYWYSWSLMIDNWHFLHFFIWYKVKCMVYTSLRMSLAYSIIQHHIIMSVLSYWYNTCTCVYIYTHKYTTL